MWPVRQLSRHRYDSIPQFSAKLSFQHDVSPLRFLLKSSPTIAFSGKAMLPRRGKTMSKPTMYGPVLLEPIGHVMDCKMLLGIKERVEATQ
jgi:hypothetical protein